MIREKIEEILRRHDSICGFEVADAAVELEELIIDTYGPAF